eukprot:scaffold105798_cov19-Tisochrysis_lutea.AAC.1
MATAHEAYLETMPLIKTFSIIITDLQGQLCAPQAWSNVPWRLCSSTFWIKKNNERVLNAVLKALQRVLVFNLAERMCALLPQHFLTACGQV